MSEVVVGFDGSEPSQHAVAWAAEEARRRGATLHVVQSWKEPVLAGPTGIDLWTDPGALVREVTESFEAEVAALVVTHPGVEVRTTLIDQPPARGLMDLGAEAEVIVVGARGRGGFAGLGLGSVSNRVARRAPVPVVVVRRNADVAADGPVLAAVDGSECSRHALRWAAIAAAQRGVGLRAVMAWNYLEPQGVHGPGEFRPDYDAHEAERVLSQIVGEVLGDAPAVPVERVTACDLPARAVLERADDASLVVMGRHGASRWSPVELGTTSQQVLHHAEAPVAVIPGPAR
ncbi:MAG: universal stress protein [Actinobacteria bacterium]|nr:universal stress protein [Actinomycetota bacterium]